MIDHLYLFDDGCFIVIPSIDTTLANVAAEAAHYCEHHPEPTQSNRKEHALA